MPSKNEVKPTQVSPEIKKCFRKPRIVFMG